MLTFAPDLPNTTPEVLTAVSAVPSARGYKSPPSGVTTNSAALSAASQGAGLMFKLDGTTRTIAGTTDALVELSGGTWTDVSRGTAYTAGSSRWRFCQFGNTTFAINKVTQLQQSSSGAFADVANAPKAECMDACAGFIVLGNCDDTGTGLTTGYGDQGHRWWTSALFSPTTTWAPSVATQATSGLLVDTPGAITCLQHAGSQMVAFKASSIYVGDFVGPPVVLDFNLASDDVGCASGDAVVSVGNTLYFPADDDFYAFSGGSLQRIGSGIREWFFARLNRSYKNTIQALHDKSNNLIYWWYPVESATALTSAVVYHYPTGRWGAFDLTITDVLEAVTSAITYSDIGTLYSTYADLPSIPYGSPFWNANTPVLAYFDATNTLQSLSGVNTAMSLTTGWIGDENVVSLCTRVRPKFRTKPSTGTITNSYVMSLGESASSDSSSTINSDRFDVLRSARYHSFAMSFTGSTEVEAIGPVLVPEGQE